MSLFDKKEKEIRNFKNLAQFYYPDLKKNIRKLFI